MMPKRLLQLALMAAIIVCLVPAGTRAGAQDGLETPVRVVTKPLDPFVIRTKQGEVGFSIELWNEIAKRSNLRTEWVANDTVGQLLDTVKSGNADVGIAGISMTKEREDQLDFSYPVFDAGLQIMVTSGHSNGFRQLLSTVFTPTLGYFALGLLVALVIAGHFVWAYQRRHGDIPKTYVKGVGHGVWLAAATALAGDIGTGAPSRVFGRLITIVWLLVGVIIVAMFTASVTSRLTVDQISSDINGPGDLIGKHVVTVTNTTSSRYLDSINVTYQGVDKIEDAYPLLSSGAADAIVYDAPVLLRHTLTLGRSTEQIVGPIFNRESYGIAVPTGSPLRERINRALLDIRADGTYAAIYQRWFGAEH